jgi:hypothetical protein
MADTYFGMPFFEKPPTRIEFTRLLEDQLFSSREPYGELDRLLKEYCTRSGRPDIPFNYAIAQNVPGVFVLRGAGTKCADSASLQVLMLLGRFEEPSDTLKENQTLFGKLTNRFPVSVLRPGDANIYVFDLIEALIERGYYQARNDGVYGPFVQQAVHRLQLATESPDVNGIYAEVTIKNLQENYASQTC